MSRTRTEKQRAASATNGAFSRGPVTDGGKAKSSRNSLKHGMTGAGIVLPHENQEAFDETLFALDNDLKPVGALEAILVKRIALTSTRLDRLAGQECAVLSLKSRKATGAYDREVQNDVEQLGKRLLDFPIPHQQSPSLEGDRPDALQWQRDEPNVLVMELKETVQGCDYLLKCWRELEHMLSHEGFWGLDSKLKAIRLLGKRYETILDDAWVGEVFVCCQALQPEMRHRWLEACAAATYWIESRMTYGPRVEKLAERIPDDPMVALDFLQKIVDAEIAALEALREELMPLYELNRAEAPIRSALDDTRQGELNRRYETANERELHKCISDFFKVRKLQAEEAVETPGDDDPDHAEPTVETPEPVIYQEPASNHSGPTRSLRNEPERDGRESPIRPSAPPNSPDSASGWGRLDP